MKSKRAFGVISLMATVASLGAIVWVGCNLVPARLVVVSTQVEPPSARVWLGVLGLESDALVAAGVTSGQASQMLLDLQAHFVESGAAMVASIEAHNAARRTQANDDRMVRAGKSPALELLVAHRQALASTSEDRVSRVNSAFNAAVARLPVDVTQRLTLIELTRAREVPAAYRLVERTDAQWNALREALVSERQFSERGESPPDAVQALLADIRAEPTTAASLQRVATVTAAVRQALQ
ncbi:MAG: hypothetical protein Q8L55_07860 [Phycisphaerales bacterium]|nr:hypothetical protein [Phycisphaerales bacterium]